MGTITRSAQRPASTEESWQTANVDSAANRARYIMRKRVTHALHSGGWQRRKVPLWWFNKYIEIPILIPIPNTLIMSGALS